jgi:Cu-Zn family superoxide dismutase
MKSAFLILIGAGLASGLSGCATHGKSKQGQITVYYARAVLQPTKGSQTSGQLWFSEAFGKVKVEAQVAGLDPNSTHGIHIHEYGDCTAPDASSAGGHYNPQAHQHGAPDSEARHVGDLGNLKTDKKGNATLSLEITNASINGTLNPIIGRAVIVHKNPDDLISQPTGGAGPRIACGVIGASTK